MRSLIGLALVIAFMVLPPRAKVAGFRYRFPSLLQEECRMRNEEGSRSPRRPVEPVGTGPAGRRRLARPPGGRPQEGAVALQGGGGLRRDLPAVEEGAH